MRILISLMAFVTITSSLFAREVKILEPKNSPVSYHHAATEFQKFYKAVTDVDLEIISEDDSLSSLIVIGPDFVNGFTRKAVEGKILAPLDLGAGSDAYRIISKTDGKRKYLFLAGGNGRSTLYAVYDFFERQAGCHYFWDGDIVPKAETIDIDNLNVFEQPRFEYRGLRYFAHRSLSRFQAEHWGPKEWEQEIDWILKKRLNLFMLRIGIDDVFQKAFPDIVPYPPVDDVWPGVTPRSFRDRTTSWPLQYRGELRKHVLQYASERELIHPEDMGTMTHWYSPTPEAFLEAVKPSFFPQTGHRYTMPIERIWDIREDENLENYWKLTQAHIDNYGSPQMFHTIGLAERGVYDDRKDNMEMKLYAYRRMISKVREHYPNAPILLAGWDFYLPGWTPEEMSKLLAQLDPSKTIILDYMSDLPYNGLSDFRSWGVVGKFPYSFGIFHAYEWENDLRGYYDNIKERMPLAVADPMCKGFVYWPENSHSDPLMLEFFTRNAWKPDVLTPEEIIPEMCRNRYGEHAAVMENAWMASLPLIKSFGGMGPLFRDIQGLISSETDENNTNYYRRCLTSVESLLSELPAVLDRLSKVPYGMGNPFVDRDAIDLARTISSRLFAVESYRYKIAQNDWKNGKASVADVRKAGESALNMLKSIRDFLTLHDDYSMNASMKQMEAVYSPLNPTFGQTLKGNAENSYCRTYILELFDYYFIPEMERYVDYVNGRLRTKALTDDNRTEKTNLQDIVEAYYEKPLAEMTPLNPRPRTNAEFRRLIKKLK